MFSQFNKKDFYILSGIISIWIILLLVSDVKGNFPLNDDWSYSYSVKTLLETGRIQLTGWVSMPIITQVLWGAFFTTLFGFSFEILRLSTIILGLAGIICTYHLFNEVTRSSYLKFIATLLVAVNPIYFLLSSSFMTDVPFFTFSMFSVLFLFKFLKSKNILYLTLGIIFVIGAAFIRQIGIVPLLAFAAAFSLNKNNTFSHKIYFFLLVFLLLILIALFPSFVQSSVNNPLINNTRMAKFFSAFTPKNFFGVLPLFKNSFVALIYIGLFSFPLWINLSNSILNKFPVQRAVLYKSIFSILTVTILILLIAINKLLPLRPGILFEYGLGPATLRDVDILGLNHISKIPYVVWAILTLVGVAGFLFISLILFLSIKNLKVKDINKINSPYLFLTLTTLLYLTLISLSDFYDRYLIFPLPLVALLILWFSERENISINYVHKFISILTLIIIMLFTLYETQNYFSWNRCRWRAIEFLTKVLKVPVDKIDGGFEFNAWSGYDAHYIPQKGKSWWWVKDDEYIVSFGKLDNYRILKKLNYSSLTKTKSLYILKKEN